MRFNLFRSKSFVAGDLLFLCRVSAKEPYFIIAINVGFS